MPRHLKIKPKKKVPLARKILVLFAIFSITAAFAGFALYALLNITLTRDREKIQLHIEQGSTARSIGKELRKQGLKIEPNVFVLATHLLKAGSKLKAGRYEIPQGLSTYELVVYLSEGKGMIFSTITLVEGLSAEQIMTQLRTRTDLSNDLVGLSNDDIALKFHLQGNSLEGWIYPDTYKYSADSRLSELLMRAINLQQDNLKKAWASRAPNLPLQTPYEALKLASIVEKETGQAADRSKIASVFVNRLKNNMLLQTDPTVIYGLGKTFDGNLTRKHLQGDDNPFNSYRRIGLPPTPISNPGKAALEAALHPAKTNYFYFVSRGDGSSYFSETLSEHNRAVRQYQLKK